ncbi:MAG: type II toxin-antitoxin system HicA family toxin [Candidatus Dormibacteraeota bacterium]|uniref:Type II toxin-antitoxin system HicA family toxin n=1 Tax=Candidatus Aeolococcus gillhamiae TaxID=3127015 RepID=A0A2W5Z9V6_9BACT|nr:type II toxin-antitoxin system HicA family toxin [Candidatus Dormibacteraeota bacterium]PZR79646.1 MAG: hypothetical protein DLM65_10260 [Candidatus Dormibacter sp. RRmetagenome_bin12]
MSDKLPSLSGAQVVKALKRAGFEPQSQRGDHVKMRHPVTGMRPIVPLHDDLAQGTLASILRQAGLTRDDLRKLL